MKISKIIIVSTMFAAVGISWLVLRNDLLFSRHVPAFSFPVQSHRAIEHPVIPLPQEGVSRSLSEVSGESHVLALEVIMDWIKHQQVLTDEDRDTLLNYLAQSKPDSLTAGEWEERVNELLNLLRSQPDGVPGLADLLIHMSSNASGPVMRMYALQHLAMWIPSEPVAANRAAMIDLLQRLAETPGDPLAGSAVLFLNDLDQPLGGPGDLPVSDKIIERTALRLVGDPSSRPDVRITALHACAARRMQDAAPTARLIAVDATLMIPLRKAAIFTLGELGNIEDRELLESLAASNIPLAAATTPALKKLNASSHSSKSANPEN